MTDGKTPMANESVQAADKVRDEYDSWHEKIGLGDAAHSPIELPWYESVHRELDLHGGGRLLEVGCGRGVFALWLARKSTKFRIVGLDFSKSAVEIAQRNARAETAAVEFFQGDAEALPFPDDSFDVVISCECMEHVLRPIVMAREIARVLKPGGIFALTTENYLNGMLFGWAMSIIRRVPFNSGSGVQPRENFFFFWMVARYLKKAGLTIEKTESSHCQWLLLPGVAPAKLCTEKFDRPWARWLARPFGRHYSFFGMKHAGPRTRKAGNRGLI
jgi:ubiquinone/menaquinone biosynthesis C-methylase UbiE